MSKKIYISILSFFVSVGMLGCVNKPESSSSQQTTQPQAHKSQPKAIKKRPMQTAPKAPIDEPLIHVQDEPALQPQEEDSQTSQEMSSTSYSQQDLENITGDQSQEEVIKNGQTYQASITYKPGTKIKHGKEVLYHPNRTIAQILFYVDGQKEGRIQIFSQRGVLVYEAFYVNGKLHGICKMFDVKSGKLKTEMNFADNLQDGVMNIYNVHGKLWHQLIYKQGKKEGVAKEFDENGKVISQRFFKNDNEVPRP